MYKHFFFALCTALLLSACSSDDTEEPAPQADRTVIIYIAGENNLSVQAYNNLQAIKRGSATMTGGNLLVYMDRAHPGELPWLGRIVGGRMADSLSLADMGISQKDEYASDPQVFEDVLRYAVSRYPATRDYGLVLWGHSTGWLMQDSLPYTRAYGFDNGHNDRETTTGYWLNLPTMSRVLGRLPVHWSYIFADCCQFMCLESLYELRQRVDYVLGSPAEIPSTGAPYEQIVPAMFDTDPLRALTVIADRYYAAEQQAQPLSIVKMSQMQDLALATRTALQAVRQNTTGTYPDMKGIIHYMYDDTRALYDFDAGHCMLYDAGHFMLRHAPASAYTAWKQVLDRTVVLRRIANRWRVAGNTPWSTRYADFEVTEENYHGVSMFVPQNPDGKTGPYKYPSYNADIKRLGWYYAAGYSDMGW